MPDRNGPWLLLDFFQANLERACESGHLRESLRNRPKMRNAASRTAGVRITRDWEPAGEYVDTTGAG